tara:strand:+ start:1080 stop:1571 length:492 start_codon:yes stop_codon:yes gene_type:complete
MPSAGDNLSLAKLGRAVGHSSNYTSQTSLAGNCGGANSQTAFSDFDGGTYTNMTTSKTNVYAETIVGTANFTSPGSKFLSRIANRHQNFVWAESSDDIGLVSISANQDYTATISIAAGPQLTDNITISCTFKEDGQTDGFNDHITGYNTAKNRVITYDPVGGP